jgi:membrane protein DedA with SNARE-associated domain
MIETLQHWLHAYGYGVITLVIGLESMGLPLPGESLLIGAAIYASVTGKLAIEWIVLAAIVGAILGDNAGFAIGRAAGPRTLARYGPRLGLTAERQALGRYLFRRHGGKVVFFGRFLAVLRTFAALLAGANGMDWPRFLVWNAAGGIVWCTLYGFGAWALGDAAQRLSTPVGIALGIVTAALALFVVVQLRRHEAAWTQAALQSERAPPRCTPPPT